MASLGELRKKIDILYPNAIYSMLSQDGNTVSKVQYTKETNEETKAAIETIIGAFDFKAKPPNLELFNQLFAQAIYEGVFTRTQFADCQIAQLIVDENMRNAGLAEIIQAGSPEQQQRLFEIAQECNIPLPQI